MKLKKFQYKLYISRWLQSKRNDCNDAKTEIHANGNIMQKGSTTGKTSTNRGGHQIPFI